jgi:hypothetical protein
MAFKGKSGTAKPAAKGAGKNKAGSEYDETNRGVLFENDKDGNENRPDKTGHIFINPADYPVDEATGLVKIRLAAWEKDSQKVGTYLSLSASPPQE